jgi:hypothetical protein
MITAIFGSFLSQFPVLMTILRSEIIYIPNFALYFLKDTSYTILILLYLQLLVAWRIHQINMKLALPATAPRLLQCPLALVSSCPL